MLVLASMFLVTIIVSASAVWLYRKLSVWHGSTVTLLGRPQSTTRMKIGAQQGFISLVPKRREKSRHVILRSPKGKVKTPWGW
jgi:hypothetical protein